MSALPMKMDGATLEAVPPVTGEMTSAQALLGQVLDQLPTGLVLVDRYGRVLYANAWVRALSPHTSPALACDPHGIATERAFRCGETVPRGEPVRIARVDGSVVHVRTTAAPVRDATGRVIAVALSSAEVPAPREGDLEPGRATEELLASLTRRERQILELVVAGESTRAIATRLSISAKTVETHRTSMNRKLGVHSTAEVVRFAARRGLLPH